MRFFGFIFFLLILFCEGKICKRDQSVDTGGTSTVYFCCSDYVPLRQSCIECPTGFRVEPEKKDKCLVCPPKNYGLKCAFDCSCSSSERCDNVDGCVSKEHNKECPPGYKVEGAECVPCASGFYGVKCLLECDCKEFEWCNATLGCVSTLKEPNETISGQTTGEDSTLREDGETPDESNMYIIISATGGCVIFVVILIVTGIAINRKVKSTKIVSQTEQSNNSTSVYEYPYNEIDENQMVNHLPVEINNTQPILPQRNKDANENAHGGYLEPISKSGEKKILEKVPEGKGNSQNARTSGYMHPYQPVIKHKCEVHKYLTTQEAVKKQDISNTRLKQPDGDENDADDDNENDDDNADDDDDEEVSDDNNDDEDDGKSGIGEDSNVNKNDKNGEVGTSQGHKPFERKE